MKDIESSDKLELQIAYPCTHQCQEEIWNTFTNHNNHAVLGDMNGIYDIGQFLNRCLEVYDILKPDMILVLGDRFETLVAATAALLLNIKIAHAHGGETTTGSFDDNIRNAITMMADYHFTAHGKYTKRVKEMLMGSPAWNQHLHLDYDEYWTDKYKVYTIGSPGLDWLHRAKLLSKHELQQYVNIDLNQPFIVACLHPVTKELEHTKHCIVSFLTAIAGTDEQIILIQPNCDPENKKIKESIRYLKTGFDIKNDKRLCVVGNLDHIVYLSLLQYAEFMVGNSSSGIIESALFNLPSVSVGNRQAGRIRGSNVFDCPCETEAILTAIDRAREWNATVGKCESPYGKGDSSEKIVKILEELLC
jgi:GDP/UDP-N,N'-diacetylbacillosamine 2-epimerase (hydrolysing)